MRGRDAAALQVIVCFLKCKDRFHRRQVENAIDRAGEESTFEKRFLDTFDA